MHSASMTLPDGPMQTLLNHARKYSSDDQSGGGGGGVSSGREQDDHEIDENRRPSINYPEGYSLDRRLSEAGVNRRPSAAQILTEDTDSFIIGETVYVDGVKKGRIQFIGDTKFGQGEWAGVFLEEPLGKNDGAVGSTRYFQCEPRHGVFARLFRLTREPIEGADEVLSQMRKYGYEIIEAPHHHHRRGSIGSSGGSGSRRGSLSIDEHHHHYPHHLHHLHPRRGSTDRGSMSPRQPRTPEMRRSSMSRSSPDTTGCMMHDPNRRGSGVGLGGDRRTSLTVPERRGSGAFIPPRSPRGTRVNPPGKSPLASPRTSRSNLGLSKPIEKDPDVNKLISEARRLSMGGSGRRGSEICDQIADEVRRNHSGARRPSSDVPSRRSTSNPRRTSESSSSSSNGGYTRSPLLNRTPRSDAHPSSKFSRKTSESLGIGARRSSSTDNKTNYLKGGRRPSSDLEAAELLSRRQSEAGLRRPSATDVVLNDMTSNLRVGMPVYVDGTKPGRIAYIGDVHFAQGIMAGVHLDRPQGKNNGSIGGIMYFQCEPKRGVFSKLHRLTVSPINGSEKIY